LTRTRFIVNLSSTVPGRAEAVNRQRLIEVAAAGNLVDREPGPVEDPEKGRRLAIRRQNDERVAGRRQVPRQLRREALHDVRRAPGAIEEVPRLAAKERWIEDHDVEALVGHRREQAAVDT